jgi:hypothetical protein
MITPSPLQGERVLGGPYSLFDGSLIITALDPSELFPGRFVSSYFIQLRSTLHRLTTAEFGTPATRYPTDHPYTAFGPRHPQRPPNHLHYDQAENSHVIFGVSHCPHRRCPKDFVREPDLHDRVERRP